MNDGFLPRGRQLDFIHQRVLQKINVRSFPLPQTRNNVQLNVLSKWAKPADGPSRPNRAIKQSINPLFLLLGSTSLHFYITFSLLCANFSQTFWIKQCIRKYGVRQAWVLPAHLATERSKEVRCYARTHTWQNIKEYCPSWLGFQASFEPYLIEMRILHPVLCKPLGSLLHQNTLILQPDSKGLPLSGKVYDECLETVETITETINYPLVRKEARALRLLIKSALIVLHIHCLKSECLV